MLDIDHHGDQGGPGEPPTCWTLIIMEVKVLLQDTPMLDVCHRGGQGAPAGHPHVGC